MRKLPTRKSIPHIRCFQVYPLPKRHIAKFKEEQLQPVSSGKLLECDHLELRALPAWFLFSIGCNCMYIVSSWDVYPCNGFQFLFVMSIRYVQSSLGGNKGVGLQGMS